MGAPAPNAKPLIKTFMTKVLGGAYDRTKMSLEAISEAVRALQADIPVDIDAESGAETDVLDFSTSGYSYKIEGLLLKCADPGADTVTVRLYQLINDVLTEVDSFSINSSNYGTYFSLVDMFGRPHLAGDSIKITVQSSAGTYAVTGQYSYSKVYTA